MPIPMSVAFPCDIYPMDALIAHRGFFNPQSILLRFVVDGRVLDYVEDSSSQWAKRRPSRPVNARALINFLINAKSDGKTVQIDRDLEGQWIREWAKIAYHVGGSYDTASIFLSKCNATSLAVWALAVVERKESFDALSVDSKNANQEAPQ